MRISYRAARLDAKHAASLMVRFLQSRRERCWAEVFSKIESALAAGDEAQAFALFRDIPMVNMGSFTDLYICRENGHKTVDQELDNDLLPLLYGNLKESLTRLRQVRRIRRRT
jgi:hypothetical protein